MIYTYSNAYTVAWQKITENAIYWLIVARWKSERKLGKLVKCHETYSLEFFSYYNSSSVISLWYSKDTKIISLL